ncbi:MAG TPA: TolC family protein [Bacteroidales bacterium]|nr:TolC family protein [Bacteroidales bacterium]
MNIKVILFRTGLPIILSILATKSSVAQENTSQEWDLNQCLNYALEHNIQVNKKKLAVLSSEADYLKSKSQRLPNLSASISESFTNSKTQSAVTSGSWDLNSGTSASISSSLLIYNGGIISNTIKQSQINVDIANLDVEITKNNIILSITQAYLNVLYAKESVDYNKEILSTSLKQVERARELIKAGSIARADLAQLEAQYASDQYSLVTAQNTLISNTTNLKQLLEIPVIDTFKVMFPEINFNKEFSSLPTINEAFNTSLSVMPDIKLSQLDQTVAEINVKIAKAGYMPTLSMNANYSTDFSNQKTNSFGTQLSDNQMQRIGLSLSIPIFNKYATSTSVQKSKITLKQADLSMQETKKNLLQNVENVYQNTIAGKSRYDAAIVQYSSADESYKISETQFNLGMINAVDLLKVKNTLLNANKELIQAKYSAILNRKILDFYLGKSISL